MGIAILILGLPFALTGLTEVLIGNPRGIRFSFYASIITVVGIIVCIFTTTQPWIYLVLLVITLFLGYKTKKMWDESRNQ